MDQEKSSDHDANDAFSPYAGRWIARSGNRVIAQGGTPEQARRAALASRPKEIPDVQFIPLPEPFVFPPQFNQVVEALPSGITAYLVGGGVRDAMLSRPTHDLDFVLAGNAIQIARKVADALRGAFYPLDEDRDYGRIILTKSTSERYVIDFTIFQGTDLDSDLRARDFTINAMAVEVHQPLALIDPLGGANDLHNKQIRICHQGSLQNDPIRILRGVRLAAGLNFRIHPDTRLQMRSDAYLLPKSSPERLRDEIFRILESSKPSTAVRALDQLGVIPVILPELAELKDIPQSPPHVFDVWNHTIGVVQNLHGLINVLNIEFEQDDAANLYLGLVSMLLGRFREKLVNHFKRLFTPERSLLPLLYLAALYHDVGKPSTLAKESSGRIRFFEHEQKGAIIAQRRATALQLSSSEILRLTTIIRHHMRPLFMAQLNDLPSRRVIYRYFRDTGAAGVDIALLSLADTLATYGPTLPQELWGHQVEVVRILLQAWWEQSEEIVSPSPLITGHDLIDELNLSPGPVIGRILEEIREAQATGIVTTREEALELARKTKSEG